MLWNKWQGRCSQLLRPTWVNFLDVSLLQGPSQQPWEWQSIQTRCKLALQHIWKSSCDHDPCCNRMTKTNNIICHGNGPPCHCYGDIRVKVNIQTAFLYEIPLFPAWSRMLWALYTYSFPLPNKIKILVFILLSKLACTITNNWSQLCSVIYNQHTYVLHAVQSSPG